MSNYLTKITCFLSITILLFTSACQQSDKTVTESETASITDKYEEIILDINAKMSNSLLLHADYNYAFVKNKKSLIDISNPKIKLMYFDEEIFFPMEFVFVSMGFKVDKDNSTYIISNDSVEIKISSDSKVFFVNGEEYLFDFQPKTEFDTLFLSVKEILPLTDLSNITGFCTGFKDMIFVAGENCSLLEDYEINYSGEMEIFNTAKYLDRHFKRNATLYEVDIQLIHETMDLRQGYPAFISMNEKYPEILICSKQDTSVEIYLRNSTTGKETIRKEPINIKGGIETLFAFDGDVQEEGTYEITVDILSGSQNVSTSNFYFSCFEQSSSSFSSIAFPGKDGKLIYVPDYLGNKIPDYSYTGYMQGKEDIPSLPVIMTLEPEPGDDTQRIQKALDEIGDLQPDENGMRGTLLLNKGIYEIEGQINISKSGVALRGQGSGDIKEMWLDPSEKLTLEELKNKVSSQNATVLIATGKSRRILINIKGLSGVELEQGTMTKITDMYVPVGANSFHVKDPETFSIGDKVIVQRIGNENWIQEIGMNQIPGDNITQWKAFDLDFEHTIVEIEENRITVDSAIMCAIDSRWGGGRMYRYDDPGRITMSGVENLRVISYWMPNEDEVDDTRHADRCIVISNARDCWVKDVATEHFYSETLGGIYTDYSSKNITIKKSSVLIAHPDFYAGPGYDSSGRTFYETNVYVGRYAFHLAGQGGLVSECYTLHSRHAYVVNARVSGPNVFYMSEGKYSLTNSEPHHRWSVGGLYDNIRDNIAVMNRLSSGTGHGWSGANYTVWNTIGQLAVQKPPTAQNWAIGHSGEKWNGFFESPDGFWELKDEQINPESLYIQQLTERIN